MADIANTMADIANKMADIANTMADIANKIADIANKMADIVMLKRDIDKRFSLSLSCSKNVNLKKQKIDGDVCVILYRS